MQDLLQFVTDLLRLACLISVSVRKQIKKTDAHIVVIPGGLTSKLQPLDIAVNHPFKCSVRNEWDKCMSEGEHTFTLAGKQRHAKYVEVCKWVLAAWQQISTETIRNGFIKAGLLNLYNPRVICAKIR